MDTTGVSVESSGNDSASTSESVSVGVSTTVGGRSSASQSSRLSSTPETGGELGGDRRDANGSADGRADESHGPPPVDNVQEESPERAKKMDLDGMIKDRMRGMVWRVVVCEVVCVVWVVD